MLNEEEIKNTYTRFRSFTIKLSSIEIAIIERDIADLAASHVEALEEIRALKKIVDMERLF